MAEAERNILVIIRGIPSVHLKGHVSRHFIIGGMRYEYTTGTQECSEEEFIAACESKGWKCMIENNIIYIQGKHHKVFIEPEGMVFIDGYPYSIEDQIYEQNKKLRY